MSDNISLKMGVKFAASPNIRPQRTHLYHFIQLAIFFRLQELYTIGFLSLHSSLIHKVLVLSLTDRRSSKFSKGLVINYGEGGLQNEKIAGLKLFLSPFS